MSQEVSVRVSLQCRKGVGFFQSQPTSFNGNIILPYKGPVPGAFVAGVGGTNVDFTNLTTPGYAVLQNLSSTTVVTYGIWDSDHSRFHPLGEILPGETYVLRLSRHLLTEYPGTGTGSGETGARLRFRAEGAPANVAVLAFDA